MKVDSWGEGGGGDGQRKCHSKFFSRPADFSALNRGALFFDHRRRCCLSPIHRRIIPPKSPKSLILFISTPHKKGALFPLLGLCVQYGRQRVHLYFDVSGDRFSTSRSNISSFANIQDVVFFYGLAVVLINGEKSTFIFTFLFLLVQPKKTVTRQCNYPLRSKCKSIPLTKIQILKSESSLLPTFITKPFQLVNQLTNQLPLSLDETRQQLLQAGLKSHRRRWRWNTGRDF